VIRFRIITTPLAQADVAAINDERTRKAISRKIDELETEPDRRGEPLYGNLQGYRKLKAARRYRIIYEVRAQGATVTVVVIGIRKEGDKRDVYQIARRRLGKR
jgi:mRNA interferase RelE/StbE